ncbi:MAG: RNA polymerase sigma factor [Planctomycetota bacterium]
MKPKASKLTNGAAADEADAPRAIALDDRELVQRTKDGDMQAFGVLVGKYQDRVFNLALRMCNRRADAEELAQEAFLRALERIGQFKGESRFYTWLFRIAANLTISHRRRSGRVRFVSMDRHDQDDPPVAETITAEVAERREPGPPAKAEAAERRDMVAEALDSLDEPFRLVLVLRDMQGMDYAEVAEVLKVPVGTVKSRLFRARCLLRQRLEGRL